MNIQYIVYNDIKETDTVCSHSSKLKTHGLSNTQKEGLISFVEK